MQVDIKATENSKIKHLIKNDPILRAWFRHPGQIDTWVEDNVNNMAQAKLVLARLARIAVFLVKNMQ